MIKCIALTEKFDPMEKNMSVNIIALTLDFKSDTDWIISAISLRWAELIQYDIQPELNNV